MKKLLVLAPFTVLLAACATNAPSTTTPSTNTQQVMQSFTCEDNGQVTASYATDGSAADLNVTLPKVGIKNQKMIVNQAVSGSGARYVNNDNPKMSYVWQTKADYGIMSVRMANGQEYSVNCQL